MPQTVIAAASAAIHELKQVGSAAAAVAAYNSSWGYADLTPGRVRFARDYSATLMGPEDFKERLVELAACEKAIAAAQHAIALYTDDMAYAEVGRAEHAKEEQCDDSGLDREEMAARLGELVAKLEAALAAAQYADSLAPAEPGLPEKKEAAWEPQPFELCDMAERLAELCAKAAEVPQYCEYGACGPMQRRAGAPAPQPYDRADMAERLAELCQRESGKQAAAALADSLAYAEPGRPEKKASAPAPQPISLADMAECFAELAAKAAPVPEWCQYATACGPAARHRGAWAPQSYELSDMHERLAELKQRVARRQALAAYGDSLDYAQPGLGRPQRKAAAPAPAPLDLSEMAERLSELCAKAAAVPQHFEYAEPSPAPAQRFAGAWAPQPYSRIELAERLAELAAKEGTRLAVASLADSLDYAQPGLGRAQRKASAAAPSPLELSDMAERLSELCQAAAQVPAWCEYAAACGPAARHGTYTATPLTLADMGERLAELCAKAAATDAVAAFADSLAYAQPGLGRPQRKAATAAAEEAPISLADMAERFAELAAKAAVVPEWCQYAAARGPAQRFAGAWAPQPYSRADLAERLAELAAATAAPRRACPTPTWCEYAQPGSPQAGPRRVAGACREEAQPTAEFAERLAELATACSH